MNRTLAAAVFLFGLSLLLLGLTGTSWSQAQVQRSFTVTVAPALAMTTTALPAGELGAPYSAQMVAAGGVPPYSFTLLLVAPFGQCGTGNWGPLPAGLTLSATGAVTGTPTAGGSFPVCVQVKDALGGVAQIRIGRVAEPGKSALQPLPPGVLVRFYPPGHTQLKQSYTWPY